MSYHKILRKLYLIILNEATNQVWNVKLRLELLLCDQDCSAYKVTIADHLACIVHELLLTYLQIKSLDPLKDAFWVHNWQCAVYCRSFHCFAYLKCLVLFDLL